MNAEEYRSQIDRLIREMSGEVILNGSHAHASIIIERMFANAEREVDILSRRFDPRIYGTCEALEQAELLLGDPDRRIRILLEDSEAINLPEHPFLVRLRQHFGQNLDVRQLPQDMRPSVTVNFAVMDEAGYRLEQEKQDSVAVASFGATAFVKRLREFFQVVWTRSAQVPLAAHA